MSPATPALAPFPAAYRVPYLIARPSVGSAGTTHQVDDALEPGSGRYPLTPFSRVTPAYHRPLRLIVRAWVA